MDDDLDSLLNAAADDILLEQASDSVAAKPDDDIDSIDELNDLLEAAADDLLTKSAAPVVKRSATSQTVSRGQNAQGTWQETLQVLPPAQRIEWATTISRDVEKLRKEGSNIAPFSFAYGSDARQQSPEENIAMAKSDSLAYEKFKKLWDNSIKGHEHEEKLRKAVDLQQIFQVYKSTLVADISERVNTYEVSDVKAAPSRFPHLTDLLS